MMFQNTSLPTPLSSLLFHFNLPILIMKQIVLLSSSSPQAAQIGAPKPMASKQKGASNKNARGGAKR